jgi:DNA-directed RNA polymerase specialized sigma24 family protein
LDGGFSLLANRAETRDFAEFFAEAEPRLRVALVACLGLELGQEASAEAFAFAWENWERVVATKNPVGYLYGVGRNKARAMNRRPVRMLVDVSSGDPPWVEPGLPNALARLSDRQRTVVMLLYCFDWSLSEVAEMMGTAKGTIQLHARRAMSKLRADLGVES